jgi:hypothetical protein
MGGRYDVWLENLIMPEMAVRTSFNSPAGANKSPTKLEFCKRLNRASCKTPNRQVLRCAIGFDEAVF